MKTPTKFVSKLSETQREELCQAMKTGNEQTRRRAHAILLSARRYSVDQIADIYEVDRDTVCDWLDRWEDEGVEGLQDQEGRGRKPTLNEKEQRQAIKIAVCPTKLTVISAKVFLLKRLADFFRTPVDSWERIQPQ